MNQDSDSDYEQVFIINDTDDCSGDQHKPFKSGNDSKRSDDYYKPKQSDINVAKSTFSGFAIFVSALFAVVLVATIIGSIFNLDITKLAIVMFFVPLLIVLLMLGNRDDSAYIAERNAMSTTSQSRRVKKKKFNNLQEYRASSDFQQDKAEIASKQTNEEKKSQQDRDDIDVAIKALVSLGFKIKRATDLVSRGLDSGIVPRETQMLVRYALSNNNKA